MDNEKETFYNIFSFSNMMLDAVDGAITFEDCDVLKNISLPGGNLVAGSYYETIYFHLRSSEFEFVVWDKISDEHWESDKNKSIMIKQSDLAPYITWEQSEIPI